MIHGLTERQSELLAFIKAILSVQKIPPSHREMMEAMGLSSTSGINRLVHALVERGYITHIPGKARSIQLATNATRAEQ